MTAPSRPDDVNSAPGTSAETTGDHPPPPAAQASVIERSDPVLVRRNRYRRLAEVGQMVGYLLIGVAVIAFLAGVATGFASPTVAVTVAGLIGACVVLPPAIVGGYAVKAAEREDRDAGRLPGRTGGPGRGGTMR